MKKYFSILALFVFAFVLFSCGGAKKSALGTEIEIPLTGKEYQSNSEFWRYTTEGTSPEISVAKEIAIQAAREQLAATVESNVKMVIDRYAENYNIAGKTELAQVYEREAVTAVKQTITGTEIVGEKMFRTENGNYRYFICLQLSKQSIMNQIMDNFEKEEKMRTEFNREEFRKFFEEEISKLK